MTNDKDSVNKKAMPLWLLRLWVRFVPKGRKEYHTTLTNAIRENPNPWWAHTSYKRHIAFGLFTPLTLCLRKAPNGVTSMEQTMGSRCKRCVKVRARIVKHINAEYEAEQEKKNLAAAA